MDGLSVAASIIAVVQIAEAVASLGHKYAASVKRAPKELRELYNGLDSFIDVLDTLQSYVAANPQSPALEKLNVPNGSLQRCNAELNELHTKLSNIKLAQSASGIVERLRWPFREKEMAQFVEKIERYKTLFTLASAADQISLSKRIEGYASNTDLVVQNIQGDLRDTTLSMHKIGINVRDTGFTVEEIRTNVQDTSLRVCEIRADQNADKRNKVLNWLYPDDFDQRHVEISENRQENTGEWLLKSPEFQELLKKNPNSRLLWGHGIPGAGKTYLSSAVIDYFKDQASSTPGNYGIAYFYFYFTDQDQQKPAHVLASLVKQLASQIAEIPAYIEGLYNELEPKNQRPKLEELYRALLSTMKSFCQVFLVFDALDECSQQHRNKLLPLFHRMGESGMNLFLTSRHHPQDIQESFHHSAKVELRAKDDDLEQYIRQKIDENARAKRLINKGQCKEKIISKLTDCANGMFLLVHFHIEYICQQTTLRGILKEIERLKISTTEEGHLDATYDRAMENIRRQPKSSVELAEKVFSWLVKAKRTLTVDEIRTAVSVEPDTYELDDIDLPDKETLVDVCAGLVTIDESSSTIRLAHYTVQEYLLKKSIIPEDADLNIVMACTTFLSFDIFAQGACASDAAFNARMVEYPFLPYASYYLFAHTRCCDEALSTKLILRFLESRETISSYSQAATLGNSYSWGGHYNRYIEYQSPLHIASTMGHVLAVQKLLEKSADVYARNSEGRTALHEAACSGHEAVVRLLLEKGANISARSKKYSKSETALHLAAEYGHEAVVRLLLEKGADISARSWGSSSSDKTALHLAAGGGHEAVVRLLLEKGADISARSWGGSPSGSKTALHLAAGDGREAVVRLLLEKGADISARTNREETALHLAARGGHEAMVRLLLEKGADISARTKCGETALHLAAEGRYAAGGGHEAVVRLLLEEGADISARTNSWFNQSKTALHLAAGGGREAVVRLLLEKGADISARTSGLIIKSKTALHLAAEHGREAVVRLLLEKGADISARSSDEFGENETALHLAAGDGHKAVVQLLLENGADASARTGSSRYDRGMTALHLAAINAHEAVVQLLLEKGADISTLDNSGATPLCRAAWSYGDRLAGTKRGPWCNVPLWRQRKVINLLLLHGNNPPPLHTGNSKYQPTNRLRGSKSDSDIWKTSELQKDVIRLEKSGDTLRNESKSFRRLHGAEGGQVASLSEVLSEEAFFLFLI